ncbi:MAG: stage sporulation protein cell division protein FtsW [Candidatus Parcubacteria bacterium]|jgi:cell division protein FtsW
MFFKKSRKRNIEKAQSKTLSRIESGADRFFLIIVSLLILSGLIIFSSATLMLVGTAKYDAVRFNQYGLGFVGGLILLYIAYKIPVSVFRKTSFYAYVCSTILMLMVFVPGVGVFHGGAYRWLSIGSFQFQPAEVYKLSAVLYMALWFCRDFGKKLDSKINFYQRTIPLLVMIGVSAIVFLLQRDTDTLMVTVAALVGMYILSGGNWKDVWGIAGLGCIALIILIFSRPYVMQRVQTFLNPSLDPTGSGYQIQQSLIAIGSGGVSGRGYGQSIQKFKYLPEPIGDSVFAVAAEEFGFIGTTTLVFLYLMFMLRGLKMATRSSSYGSLVIGGILFLITVQSFLNITAMLAIVPLSGMPLIFISHGGTALLMALFSVGIMLSASKEKKIGVR